MMMTAKTKMMMTTRHDWTDETISIFSGRPDDLIGPSVLRILPRSSSALVAMLDSGKSCTEDRMTTFIYSLVTHITRGKKVIGTSVTFSVTFPCSVVQPVDKADVSRSFCRIRVMSSESEALRLPCMHAGDKACQP